MQEFINDFADKKVVSYIKYRYRPAGEPPLKPSVTEWETKYKKSLAEYLKNLDPQPESRGISTFISFNNIKNGKVVKNKRETLKVDRFVTRKIIAFLEKINIKNIDFYSFASSLNLTFFNDVFRFDLYNGVDITENYKEGIGGSSCMTGSYARYTRFYEINPDRFSQLVATINNNSARAMVFKLDCGEWYCGKTYCNSNDVREKLEEYAESKGWYDVSSEIKIMTKLKFVNGEVPYLDSLCQYNLKNQKIDIFDRDADYPFSSLGYLDSTNGYIDDDDTTYCGDCEERIDGEENNIGGRILCSNCFEDNYFMCEFCEDYHQIEYINEVDGVIICNSCFQNQCSPCINCGTVLLSKNMLETSDGESVCKDCIDKYDEDEEEEI